MRKLKKYKIIEDNFRNEFITGERKAEIITEQKVTFHTARHTFGTMFLTEGVPLESLSKMMGHKNISTTQIYAKITSQKISKDMDLVAPKFKEIEEAFLQVI